ncbi:MAG: hypothetical protein DMF69_20880 [Acidobacteria bacterium]|nr:MAG: hypothetical protein DMF69_20880 [Acidobacteriota bacterium]
MSNGEKLRSSLKAYALGLIAVLAAVFLRRLLDPLLGDSYPLVTLFGAVAAAVWLRGYRLAIPVSLLGYLACHFFFLEPRHHFDLTGTDNIVGLVAYLFTCSLIILFGEAMKTAQTRASQQSEVLRVTLGSIGDAVITTDTEGRITYMNRVAESLTGWSFREAHNQPLQAVFQIVNESTRLQVENPAKRALQDGIVVGLANHTVLIKKDGNECPIDDSAAPIRDEEGRVTGCVLIFRDVSSQRALERDKAQQLLTARLLASIVESSNDAIIGKTLDGVIQSWNAAAEQLFGFTTEQAVGQHISFIIPDERIDEETHIISSLKAGKRVEHFETERVRSDGKRVSVSLTVSPIKDDTGSVVGASKIVRDFTKQRAVEERERELLAQAAEANAKFQAFFEQGALFAGIADVSGTVVAANRQSCFHGKAAGSQRSKLLENHFGNAPGGHLLRTWWIRSKRLPTKRRLAHRFVRRCPTSSVMAANVLPTS